MNEAESDSFEACDEIFDITILNQDGSETVYRSCKKLIGGGSKHIFDLGNGEVVTCIGRDAAYIQSEIDFSNELRRIGLRAQKYESVNVRLDDKNNSLLGLKMPSFLALSEEGVQVRDQKNTASSSGKSLIFGNVENLTNEDHWQKILYPLIADIYAYILNGLSFSWDSWNAVIEDTRETAIKRKASSSLLFSDLGQEIHFYFFDFGHNVINPSRLKKKMSFLNLNGNASDEAIRIEVNGLKDIVFSLVVHSLPVSEEYERFIRDNANVGRPIFEKIWIKVADAVVVKIKNNLDNLEELQRWELYGQKDPIFQELSKLRDRLKNFSLLNNSGDRENEGSVNPSLTHHKNLIVDENELTNCTLSQDDISAHVVDVSNIMITIKEENSSIKTSASQCLFSKNKNAAAVISLILLDENNIKVEFQFNSKETADLYYQKIPNDCKEFIKCDRNGNITILNSNDKSTFGAYVSKNGNYGISFPSQNFCDLCCILLGMKGKFVDFGMENNEGKIIIAPKFFDRQKKEPNIQKSKPNNDNCRLM